MYSQVMFMVTLRNIYASAFRLDNDYKEFEDKLAIQVSPDNLLCIEFVIFWVLRVGPMPIFS